MCIKYGQHVADVKLKVYNIEEGNQVTGLAREVRDFDYQCYTRNGRMPVIIKIYSNIYVTCLQFQYVDKPVNCKPTRIELIGSLQTKLLDYEILGITVGSTCTSLVQQLCLTVIQSDSKSKTDVTLDTNEKIELSSVIRQHERGSFNFFFNKKGNEYRYTIMDKTEKKNLAKSIESDMKTQEIKKLQKTTINYQGPGASIVVGYRTRYNIAENVTVRYNYSCEVGSKPSTTARLPITGNVFGKVHFQDFHFPIMNTKCTTEVRVCISRIKLDDNAINLKLFQLTLTTEVNKCLSVNTRTKSEQSTIGLGVNSLNAH